MDLKKLHRLTGIYLSVFIGIHLFNHGYSILGIAKHLELMNTLRTVYRHTWVEFSLLLAVCVQLYTGYRLFKTSSNVMRTNAEKLQRWTGAYLGFFIVMHWGAVMVARVWLKLDTNVYFGAAGINTYPYMLFFIPYYTLAISSFFGHLAAIHSRKMTVDVCGLTPNTQAKLIGCFGLGISILLLYGLTNRFEGMLLPPSYQMHFGK